MAKARTTRWTTCMMLLTCVLGCGETWSLGESPCEPVAEVCSDGLDNNCDGQVDEPACQEWPGRPLPGRVVGMAAGDFHTCAWLDDGNAYCWGLNDTGQAGDGTRASHSYPVPALGLPPIDGLVAGAEHTCAWLGDGTARCWGDNEHGQLGDGTHVSRTLPVRVDLDSITHMAAGRHHTCASTRDGRVHCWGRNPFGELGDVALGESRSSPSAVSGPLAAAGASAGPFHSCAWSSTDVWCWGNNDASQLGLGLGRISGAHGPSALGLSRVSAVVAGGGPSPDGGALDPGHTCALAGDSVACWGDSTHGQSGERIGVHTPTVFPGLSGVVALAAGGRHSCAVGADGTLFCWGANSRLQIGTGPPLSPVAEPGEVLSGRVVRGVTAGNGHTCAWDSEGLAWCWGSNRHGALGHAQGSMPAEVGR